MGGGKGKAPPPPDYSKIAAANEASAKISAEVAREQLAWAREQYASDKKTNQPIIDTFIDSQKLQSKYSAEDRARYKQVGIPLEDQLIAKAKDYATEGRKQKEEAKAIATVNQQYESARQASESQLASYGIDPGQIRMGALDIGARTAKAAAAVGASAQARQMVENKGDAYLGAALDALKGLPSQVVQGTVAATQAGQAGIGGVLGTTASGAASMGTGTQWQGLSNQALGNWGQYSSNIYNTQMNYRAQQAANSPFKAIGQLAGMGLGAWAGGGFAQEGGAIPEEASPSRGAIPDDVPLAVTAGEYVLPEDVVRRKGTEFFDKLVEKTRNPKASGKAPKREAQPAGEADPGMIAALLDRLVPRTGGIPEPMAA